MDARSGISSQAAANPGRGITEREIHLRNGSKLFKQTEPPLYDEEHVVGIVTDRDIVTRFVSRDDAAINCAVRDILTADVVCCHDRQDMRKAAEIMGDHQLRQLPVLDDNDHLVGIVTLGDIARDGSEHLAGEALGEIVEDR